LKMTTLDACHHPPAMRAIQGSTSKLGRQQGTVTRKPSEVPELAAISVRPSARRILPAGNGSVKSFNYFVTKFDGPVTGSDYLRPVGPLPAPSIGPPD
jgi:hypothetical protein